MWRRTPRDCRSSFVRRGISCDRQRVLSCESRFSRKENNSIVLPSPYEAVIGSWWDLLIIGRVMTVWVGGGLTGWHTHIHSLFCIFHFLWIIHRVSLYCAHKHYLLGTRYLLLLLMSAGRTAACHWSVQLGCHLRYLANAQLFGSSLVDRPEQSIRDTQKNLSNII